MVDIDVSAALATADLVVAAGGTAIAVAADCSAEADVQAAVGAALQQWQRLDVLVNNAAR